MKKLSEVNNWMQGAMAELGDPSGPVGQIFARFAAQPSPDQDLILAAWHEKKLHIDFGGGWLPIPIDEDGPKQDPETGQLLFFGISKIVPGVWSLSPSLNMPGIIHVFAHIYGVPDPAPWESQIIVVSSLSMARRA